MNMKHHKAAAAAIMLILCAGLFCQCGGEQQNGKEQIKFKQYLVEGKRLYLKHCGNCHQENGEGLGRLYPPLSNSDYLLDMENFGRIVCSVRYGQTGEVVVNGVVYNQPMPANPWLTDLEIAEIITYVYSTWGGTETLYAHQEIRQVLDSCKVSARAR